MASSVKISVLDLMPHRSDQSQHQTTLDFYRWLEWIAAEQLSSAQQTAKEVSTSTTRRAEADDIVIITIVMDSIPRVIRMFMSACRYPPSYPHHSRT